MKSHSLKFLRIAFALVFLLGLTYLFVDFSGRAAAWLAWAAKIQFVPAVLAVNVVAIIFLAVLTLVFGRLYCSVICPLGITQDILIRIRRCFARRSKRRLGLYRYTPARKGWRYGFLALFAVLFILGLFAIPMSLAGILDPYSAFGRMAGQGLVPVWRSAMASVAESQAASGNYIFDAEVPEALANFNMAVASVAAVTFIVIVVMAFRTGRGYCNTVCPVGTVLGFLSRFSLLKPVIDTDRCNRCGSCGRHCKAKCIDTKNHQIDYSRCVVCMDCINNCTQGAISYSFAPGRRKPAAGTSAPKQEPDGGRRAFMVGTAIVAGATAMKAAEKVTDGGFTPVSRKKRYAEAAPAVPAGAASLNHLRSHCTACQLCISECPNGVLRPGTSLDGFMQPVMTFTDGFCPVSCNRCGTICPTGAIKPVTSEEKSAIKIGTAHVRYDICISAADGVSCGNCARHCPAGAISMIEGPDGHKRPVVNESVCIGCGDCEYHCPVGRVVTDSSDCSAIYVEGLETHQQI